ncbi:MAG: ATP-binding protein [Polaromonas sp.]
MSRFLDSFRGDSPDSAPGGTGPAVNAPDWGPLDLTSDGIVLLDARLSITDANALALELLQSTRSAVTGREFWDILPEQIAEQHQGATEQALGHLPRHSFVAHQEFAGSWIEYTFWRHAAGYVVNLRDVGLAQRQQQSLANSEKYNQVIFEANPNAMWVFDAVSLRIFAANQAAVSFYRMPRAKFVTLGLEALFPDADASALLDSLRANMGIKDVRPRLSLCRQQKMDGEQALVELAWSLIDWNDQQAVMVSVADISQRHLADSALRRANAELEQALAARQTELQSARHELVAFTQAISSDLQDSLHAAHGFSVRLAEKYSAVLDEPGRHYVKRIQASIRQLSKLVDDLRTLSQLSHRAGLPEVFDLVPAAQALVADLRKRDPTRVVTIEIPAGLRIVGDRNLLVTALGCLLENAWKFSSRKSEAWIRLGLARGKAPGEMILEVSDNGAGFDPDYSGKLFTAFQRLHSSADFPGNGLGLAIVKRVAELHGGSVWGKSGDQAGATFFMALPGASATDGPMA